MSLEQRRFGATDLQVSAIGFGTWALGGSASSGGVAYGWGDTDEAESLRALARARELGINFFDTADVYGFGIAEERIGQAFGDRDDVVIATKAGQVPGADGKLVGDYSAAHVVSACEASLRRLRRSRIDFFQLHTAKIAHLEAGGCLEAVERLQAQGKIRYWGVSLNTFEPVREAEWLIERQLGHGFQLVLNLLNRRALPLLARMAAGGYGVIARVPLQFGLLGGRLTRDTRFPADDHRSVRLSPDVLAEALDVLERDVFPLAAARGLTADAMAIGFAAHFAEVATVIPGIRTVAHAERNASAPTRLPPDLQQRLLDLGPVLTALFESLERRG
ncbi:MAG: aldo/keto reductase [Vicinamibacteria bacterium]|nr:aldo/keto reductase [Vicinamibacteria bacterium]